MKKQEIHNSENPTHNLDKVVFLRGKKVVLRPLGMDDIHDLLSWVNDPEIRQYILRFQPCTEKMEREWLESHGSKANDITLGIVAKGRLIGSMGIHGISWKDRHGEIGILIGQRKNQEKGYGTDAATTLIEYGFNTLNLHKLFWKAKEFNGRSVNCAKKCGFTVEACLKDFFFVNGAYCNELVLGLTRDEWLELNKAK